jgi:excisionase family DNA binding protein
MELLRVSEASKLCRVTPYTIRKWIKDGKLSAIQIGKGGHYLINKLDLPTFMRKESR